MFCFGLKENDRIVLLDHEYEFNEQSFVNNDLDEFAECILTYNTFIESIQTKYGEDAFLDSTFKEEDIRELIGNFAIINPDLLKRNDFWNIELNGLLEEIK